jgi:hypothetical protein
MYMPLISVALETPFSLCVGEIFGALFYFAV